MRSLDTNILARVILGDDAGQAAIAERLLAEPCWITETVWLELGWLLTKRLGHGREMVAAALETLLAIETVETDKRDALSWAIDQYRAGADWADAVHVAMSANVADSFATFDRGIAARLAGAGPLPIETLS